MSENNNQKRNREKDSFVKPGDENIVSGKSFFLSFGNKKKSPSNPLIESEKNKNNQKNNEQAANQNQQENAPSAKQNNGEVKQNTGKNAEKKGKFQNNHHGNKNRNQNREKPQVNHDTEKKTVKSEEKTAVLPHEENHDNRDAGRDNRDKNRNNKQNRGPNHRQGKPQNARESEKEPVREEKKQEKPVQNRQNHKKNPANDQRIQAENNLTENNTVNAEKSLNQKKNLTNPKFEDKKRPKHKKEKFVPSVPEENIKTEELLQPIVDRTGIVSSSPRGIGMRTSGFGTFMQQGNKTTDVSDKNEPRYIDRNRPLAEQIIEQSKPKTYKNHMTENTETVEVIGVRFREAGKVYYFDPLTNKVEKGQPVIVETARGVEYGFCAISNRQVSIDNIVPPLKPILRTATADDTERYESNKQLEAGAAKIFREKVRELGLEMSLVYVEYTFDNGKLLFYFTADGRVDFRELIKELAGAFRTRIELRQIGVRDEAKIVGGLGICGRPVCCKSFLGEFSQVSIKMAKDQNLFINSSKISGTCGRFMCCIRYEDEVYQKEYETTPKVDAIVETPEGKGIVVESNALKGVVKVLLDDKPEDLPKPYKCTEIKLLGYIKRENENDVPDGVDIPEEGSGS